MSDEYLWSIKFLPSFTLLIMTLTGGLILWLHPEHKEDRAWMGLSMIAWVMATTPLCFYELSVHPSRLICSFAMISNGLSGIFFFFYLPYYFRTTIRKKHFRLILILFILNSLFPFVCSRWELNFVSMLLLYTLLIIPMLYLMIASVRYLGSNSDESRSQQSKRHRLRSNLLSSIAIALFLWTIFQYSFLSLTTYIAFIFSLWLMAYYRSVYAYTIKIEHSSSQASSCTKKRSPENPGHIREHALMKKLELWIKDEHPFTDPNFRLQHIAQKLGITDRHASGLLNRQHQLAFADYIKKHRIIYATQLMEQYPELRIKEIAYKSGFGSHTAFTRTFSEVKGCSPTQWKIQQHQPL